MTTFFYFYDVVVDIFIFTCLQIFSIFTNAYFVEELPFIIMVPVGDADTVSSVHGGSSI
jgi:hypothetical protein